MPLPRHLFAPLRNRDPQTYQGIQALADYTEALAASLGLDPQPAAQTRGSESVPAPLPASAFVVTGNDGRFQIQITDAPANHQPVLHELRSATSLSFDAVSSLRIHGPEARTNWLIEDPGATCYWQLRSRYWNSAFCSPTLYRSAGASGPTAIAAGVLRAVSTNPRLQRTASTVTVFAEFVANGSPLQNGDTSDGTPTLDWQAGSLYTDAGNQQLSIPKTTLRGLTAGQTVAVGWNTQSMTATLSGNANAMLADPLVLLAVVTLPAASGGAASSAGGGTNGLGTSSNGGRYSFI